MFYSNLVLFNVKMYNKLHGLTFWRQGSVLWRIQEVGKCSVGAKSLCCAAFTEKWRSYAELDVQPLKNRCSADSTQYKGVPKGTRNNTSLGGATVERNYPTRPASCHTFWVHSIRWILPGSFSSGTVVFSCDQFRAVIVFCDGRFKWTVCGCEILFRGCKNSTMIDHE